MSRFPLRLAWLLPVAALAMAGCGTGNRELQTLSISPATATANGSPVQFTATGHWSQPPTMVTPEPATWSACTTSSVPTTNVTVSSAGLATCARGAKGDVRRLRMGSAIRRNRARLQCNHRLRTGMRPGFRERATHLPITAHLPVIDVPAGR